MEKEKKNIGNFGDFMNQYMSDTKPKEEEVSQEAPVREQQLKESKPEEIDDAGDDLNTEEVDNELEDQEDQQADQDKDQEIESPDDDKEDDLSFDDWDEDSEGEVDDVEAKSFNYSGLAKELGFEDVEDKEKLIEKISEIKSQMDDFKTKAEMLSEIPEDLKEAIDLYKQGGDYLEYLGVRSIDYNNYSDQDLIANSVASYFTDESGNVDMEQVNDYVDSLSDKEVKIRAGQLRKSLQESQSQKQTKLKASAEAAQKAQRQGLKKALEEIKDIDGFKLDPTHKRSIYDKISKGNMLKDLFYSQDGNLDYKKVASVYFREINREKIQKAYEKKIRNATKKEVWRSTTNTQLDKPTQKAEASPEVRNSLDKYLNQLKGKN